jgi:hypothetical protein
MMDREQIIEWAREAGIHHAFDSEGQWDGLTDEILIKRHPAHPADLIYGQQRTAQILERFAKLVRDDYSNKHAQLWLKRIDEAVKAEREAIAAMVKPLDESLADEILARGNT